MAGAPSRETAASAEEHVARTVAGQMPGMAVFTETQQASVVERRRAQVWRDAQIAYSSRSQKPSSLSRLPAIAGVLLVVGLIAAFFVLRSDHQQQVSLTTASDDLPWRSVAFEPMSTVELPGAATVSSVTSEIGTGSRIATTIPGATIAVDTFRPDYGMRGSGATAMDLLKAKAADLGDDTAASRIRQNRDRWGTAYDVDVIADVPVARLRVVVVGATLYMIEVVGPQTPRTSAIFSHVINTLVPKT